MLSTLWQMSAKTNLEMLDSFMALMKVFPYDRVTNKACGNKCLSAPQPTCQNILILPF